MKAYVTLDLMSVGFILISSYVCRSYEATPKFNRSPHIVKPTNKKMLFKNFEDFKQPNVPSLSEHNLTYLVFV